MIKVEKQKYTTQSGQLMAVMEQLQLSGMERRLAESYLKGESGKESRPSPPQREIAVLVLSKWNTPPGPGGSVEPAGEGEKRQNQIPAGGGAGPDGRGGLVSGF